jgi:alkylhydroperoxidase family enzyme
VATGTWLPDLPEEGTDWERVSALFPAAFDAVADLQRAVWESFDPVLLELSRLRIATLLGFQAGLVLRSRRARDAGLTEEKIGALSAWPTSDLYDTRERSCLALVEQFVMDANGVTEDMLGNVLRDLSPEQCHTFVLAISAFETFQRGCLTLGLGDSPESAWLESADASNPPEDGRSVPAVSGSK